MSVTSVQLWDAIYRLGADDLTADNIPPTFIAKLIAFKTAALDAAGLPQLTSYGVRCFTALESGQGVVPELHSMAATEEQQRQ